VLTIVDEQIEVFEKVVSQYAADVGISSFELSQVLNDQTTKRSVTDFDPVCS